jgi:hypothetical protein
MQRITTETSANSTTMNRRITQRLHEFWNEMHAYGSTPNPAIVSVDATNFLEDIWPYCFIISVEEIALGANNYTYQYFGSELAQAYRTTQLDKTNSPPLASDRASRLHRTYAEVLKSRNPISWENEYISADGQTIKYRQALLPFVNRRNRVTTIVGGLRFKHYATEALTVA